MRLTHLTIRNIGHLENFDADIPAVCLITGANGVGKSTILEALMYAAGRRVGHTDIQGKTKTINDSTAEQTKTIYEEASRRVKVIEEDARQKAYVLANEYQKAIGAVDAERATFIESTRAKANQEAEEIQSANRPRHDELTAQVSEAQTRAEVQLQAEGARNAAILTADNAVAARAKAAVLTGAIERLRDLKTEVSKRMDLEGVTIASARGGPVDLCREEAGALVPFSHWNTKDKNVMCLRIALKAQAACGLVVIDSLGDFDEESVRDLREACMDYAAKGVNFLVGDATRGPLTVEAWK